MVSIEYFVTACANEIKIRQPFIAYWYPQGFSLVRLGTVKLKQWAVHVSAGPDEPDEIWLADTPQGADLLLRNAARRGLTVVDTEEQERVKKVKASIGKAMQKIIAKLRKDPRACHSLYVVEYDGTNLSTEGGLELDALQREVVL